MNAEALKQRLEALGSVLSQHDDTDALAMVHRALVASEEDLRSFLNSNELWGGAGSIADQAGIIQGPEVRRQVEGALISLGVEQMQQGEVNSRTEMWVEAFSKLQREHN